MPDNNKNTSIKIKHRLPNGQYFYMTVTPPKCGTVK